MRKKERGKRDMERDGHKERCREVKRLRERGERERVGGREGEQRDRKRGRLRERRREKDRSSV